MNSAIYKMWGNGVASTVRQALNLLVSIKQACQAFPPNTLFIASMLLFAYWLDISNTAEAGEPYPILSFVKDGKIPETQWLPYEQYPDDVAQAQAAWIKTKPVLERQLTMTAIKENLRVEESDLGFAEGYVNPGAIFSDSLTPFAQIDKGGSRRWLVFENSYGPLRPSVPLVARWIKTYITYDTADKRIIRVTMGVDARKLE
jgi:hypothetical protein